ncbi:hypothetical protein Dda_8064 [Drechslerella dactyloides]|uniref:Uncharacterized protein n=1 Tax=Drechslerella dactyloides TaxID=74499 RepID=A0AAD6IRC5_DREDA|nr:hypothetical protein Dda_8064 [Drechslerella dactyloides]
MRWATSIISATETARDILGASCRLTQNPLIGKLDRTPGMHFIVSTDTNKADAGTRKLIRSHVMLGKNLGKSRPKKKRPQQQQQRPPQDAQPERAQASDPELERQLRTGSGFMPVNVPGRVGSDLSFVHFPDVIDPAMVRDIMTFSQTSKEILFPLATCFAFDRENKTWWVALTVDPAYLNATAFVTSAYSSVIHSGGKTSATGRQLSAAGTMHFVKTLRMVRERLASDNQELLLSDGTIFVILMLAMYAMLSGDGATAFHHVEGLRRIVKLRGGIRSFRSNEKLLIELLRADMSVALNGGHQPLFFSDPFLEPFLPYPDHPALRVPQARTTAKEDPIDRFVDTLHPDLAIAWTFTQRFSSLMNVTAASGVRLPQRTLLHAMTATTYRLLGMHGRFAPTSADEALRLGLLGFCAHIFLRWKYMRIEYTYLPVAYRAALAGLELEGCVEGGNGMPPQVVLWLLMIGAIAVFGDADAGWLRPWMKASCGVCGAQSWEDVRGILKMIWVDKLHDEAGKEAYEACLVDDEGITVPP